MNAISLLRYAMINFLELCLHFQEINERTGQEIETPLNERGELSLSTKKWRSYANFHPFLDYWTTMEKANKYYQYVGMS